MDFSRTKITFRRPITSYSKVQAVISRLIRSRKFQLRTTPKSAYMNVGCGPNIHPGFVNVDYQWRPGVVCWDITQGLPAADRSISGAFTEHCLEHLPLPQGYALLGEIRRVLAPGALLRIVVPDGELYLREYAAGAQARFPYEEGDQFMGVRTPMMSVNRIFYVQREQAFGHNFMYDFQTLEKVLRLAGYTDIKRVSFMTGADPKLLIDSESRRVESLYVEARA